jgi:hypothetical protein
MFKTRDKDVTMMVKSVWARMGLKPFEDEYDGSTKDGQA